ncbi:hypothetical protein [Kibdelosporangium aridum]|uniref:hypothetical protein n=1 Tax=Kibdelosporangium aridum TaxID=2030 RepID=UPI000527C466
MPLQAWLCDVCGELVTSHPNNGLVVWRTDRAGDGFRKYDFKIVHKTIDSDPEPQRCDPGSSEGYHSSLDLKLFLGPNGLAMLLSWLSIGPLKGGGSAPQVENMDEFVDFVRRVQTPYYEEARSRFDEEKTHHWLGDANEYHPYLPETLRRIADGTFGE